MDIRFCRLFYTLGLCAALAAGCSADAILSSGGVGDGSDAEGTGDVLGTDVESDLDDSEVNGGRDVTPDGPGEGELGYPCEDDLECLSRHCIQRDDGYICTELCAAGSCPDGWGCRTIETSGADATQICVPNPDMLCRLCDNNTDCSATNDMCIEVGEDWVCGRACEESVDCPTGYFCSNVVDQALREGRQCIPDTSECTCSPVGDNRPCVIQNGFGICEGIEVCLGGDGWSRCTASEPIEEVCDGIDNDCDRLIDEGLVAKPCFSTPNDLGSCEGIETCEGLAGWVCNAVAASIEVCDRIDNDCNDIIDDGICYDGDVCTDDICDVDGGECQYIARAGPCDDENACTRNDRCVEGECAGEALICFDDNQCTSDNCDPLSGCTFEVTDGAPCEIGNFCTADTCNGSTCVQGPAEDCPARLPCQIASCDPDIGCEIERLSGNLCDDDNVCTTRDECSAGECIPGDPACLGRPCTNCEGEWTTLGTCINLFGSPSCICLCF
jgi:hypothetical protein